MHSALSLRWLPSLHFDGCLPSGAGGISSCSLHRSVGASSTNQNGANGGSGLASSITGTLLILISLAAVGILNALALTHSNRQSCLFRLPSQRA